MPGMADVRLSQEFLAAMRERLDKPVPDTRDAATIVVLRDGESGLEAYLLRRVPTMAFAARMHVFPGGRVDPADTAAHADWYGTQPEDWTGVLGADASLAHGLVCAAVRETFEEAGVLLAGTGPDDVADVSGADWEADRLALLDRRESLSDLLTRRGLGLRADLLRPWAHWITPEQEPRRYNTRFFVAALPAGQHTRDVGGEADATLWISPTEAITRYAQEDLEMLPPTVITLSELSKYETTAEVITAALARDITPVLPKLVVSGDEVELLLPDDDGYPS